MGEREIWLERDGFTYWRKAAERILYFLMRNGPSTANEVQRSGSVSGRAAASYVRAMTDAGLVTVNKERHLCRNGRQILSNVIRLASPETVNATLRGKNLPEADRYLWDALRRLTEAQEPNADTSPPMTLEDILGAV